MYGIPNSFSLLEFGFFFKLIGNECGELGSLAQATLSNSRMDMATILISTTHDLVPSCLRFSIKGNLIELKIIEITTEVLLADEEDDGGSNYSSDSEDVEEACSNLDSFQKGQSYDSRDDNQDLISKVQDLS